MIEPSNEDRFNSPQSVQDYIRDLETALERVEKRLESANKCDWCGSKDLVCGKAWKDERDGIKAKVARLEKLVESVDKWYHETDGFDSQQLSDTYTAWREANGEKPMRGLPDGRE